MRWEERWEDGWDPLFFILLRPIPDVGDWETLLQAMRRGSYLTLLCLVPTVGRNLGRGVCVCVLRD